MSHSHHDYKHDKRKKRREREHRREHGRSDNHAPSAPPLETSSFGAKQFSRHDEHLDSKPPGLTMHQQHSADAPPPLYMQAPSANAKANAYANTDNADVDLAAGQPRRHLPARRAGRETCCDRWCDANMIVFWPDCYDCWWLSWNGMWECCDCTCMRGACSWPRLGGNCDACRDDDNHVRCCDCDCGSCNGPCLCKDDCEFKCCCETSGACCDCSCDGCGGCGDCGGGGCDCNC
jgi:hypothetical protein